MSADLPPDEARLYRLPTRPDTHDADRLARSGDVIDGDVRDAGEGVPPVLVDQPATAEDRSLYDAFRQAREARRRPIVPSWARRTRNWLALLRWALDYAAYTAGYHLARVPLYGLRLAVRAPRGLGRVAGTVCRWVLDTEGRPLRDAAAARGDDVMYLRLSEQREERVSRRTRLAVTVGALSAIAVVILVLLPWWLRYPVIGVVVTVLGVAGTNPDQPVFTRAVVPHAVQRLTSDIVVRALGVLGLAEMNKALAKGGGDVTFPNPITRDGPGWRADVDLPHGVIVADIVERRERLASGLRRPIGCVWPEPDQTEHAGRLVLWVGDQDMSKAKPRPWPLATTGQADLFAAVPFGHDQRGRLVTVLLMFANVLIGAMPRQGKTFALRVLLLAAALDPSAQLRVFELKGTGDLSALEKVAHHYGSGNDDDVIVSCVASLRHLVHEELPRRAKTIRALPKDICPESKVTPDLAARRSLGLFPIVLGIDECQELFSHPKYGAEAGDLCTRLIKVGPALGLILILATQRPDKDSLPTGVSANVGIRFCLRVMGQTENDMVLGTSMYRNGIRATTFTNRDKGIGYLLGAADEPQIVRGAYIDAPTAERIAQRARAVRQAAGTLDGHAIGEHADDGDHVQVSVLVDVATVIRPSEDKVWSEIVADRLAALRPRTYGAWASQPARAKAGQVAAALKPYGVRTVQVWATGPNGESGNRRGLVRAEVLAAIERHGLTMSDEGGRR
jgi:S-DNA-T family DNA segregation ATPase FtsK/SpoIIIE